jgi:hypothetical protein
MPCTDQSSVRYVPHKRSIPASDHIETLISNLLFDSVRFLPLTSRNTGNGHIGRNRRQICLVWLLGYVVKVPQNRSVSRTEAMWLHPSRRRRFSIPY